MKNINQINSPDRKHTEQAYARMHNIRALAARQFASAYTLCRSNTPQLLNKLWQEEQAFSRSLGNTTNLQVEPVDDHALEIDFEHEPLVVISHNVPIDKTIFVPKAQFLHELRQK